jgi:uroporphyrin-III C-methyltransferase/precorrin-2 dehydrogenase/sirohydrochlorin ferrochelatase
LRLRGRTVVVIGGGETAYRAVLDLLEHGPVISVIAPHVTPVIAGLARSREITWLARAYRTGDLTHAWYAIAATDDRTTDIAILSEAEERHIFCSRSGGSRASSLVPDRVPDMIASKGHGSVAGATSGTLSGTIALVGAGPGDPDLITVRGRRLLDAADIVVADRLVPRALLAGLRSRTELVDAAKLPRGPFREQESINMLMISAAREGKSVVRLKGGDPFVFGRGFEEILACAADGLTCTVVPGVSSAIGVPALAGIPVTHRGVAHEFTVVSGHLPPGDPRSLPNWLAIAELSGTLILLMAVENLQAITEFLMAHGRDSHTPTCVVQEGATARMKFVRSALCKIAEDASDAGIRAPAVTIIGDVVGISRPDIDCRT